MSWPIASDFQTILQNPAIAFRDPCLRSCTIERDARGQPRAWAGSFAVVYKGIDPSGKATAIRVFSTESPQRRGRYAQIGAHLAKRRLECLVSFDYREEEIRSLSDGKRYPLLLMDWVEGETLFHWVQQQCRAGNPAALESAARQWTAVVAELAREEIAHGDLQHANVMVTQPGELKLVDYDGMCVPVLVGEKCVEVGTPPYQHPQRNAALRLSLRLDDFSSLVIYVALQALAANPTLWTKYVEQTQNDKLLFREDDFRLPQESALRRELLHSSERHVREVAELLFAAAGGDLNQVPLLAEIVDRRRLPMITAGSPAPPRIASLQDRQARPLPAARPKAQNAAAAISMPQLRGYEVLAEIGSGVLARVFLAQATQSGRQVAVKVVPNRNPTSELARRRFLAAMDQVMRARHPNIAALLERGALENDFYLVSEYCSGGNLAQWLAAGGGKRSSTEVRPVMQQCLDALKQAHLHRLVHGSLTPENILFAQHDGRTLAKVSDFTLAKEWGRTAAGPPTQGIDPLAAGFMPPERLTSEHGLNSRSDLWSLAAVFYYALSGSSPWNFRGRNPLEVISREEPVSLRERGEAIPVSVAEVIDRALRPVPAQRYRSAAEMKAAWDAAF